MKSFLVSIAVVCLFLSCKKSNDTTAPSSFSFTLNGTTYNSAKCYYTQGTAGTSSYSTLSDSATTNSSSRMAGVTFTFSTTGRPTAGDISIAGNIGTPTGSIVTIYALEKTSSTNFIFYSVLVAPSTKATLKDNGKISITIPAVTLSGQEYNNDFTHPVGSTFTTTLSATTFTEQ